MTACDLCGLEVLPGQARYGLVDPSKARHWECQARENHLPVRASLQPARQQPARQLLARRAVKAPAVRKGPTNYSENAAREYQCTGRTISEMGRRRIEIECPFCWQTFWAFVWSLAGGGKRCPNCKAMHVSGRNAYPVEGNESL